MAPRYTPEQQEAVRAQRGGGKVCPSCGAWKDYSEYDASNDKKDGKQAICKACRSARKRRYTDDEIAEYRAAHPVKVCGKCKREKTYDEFPGGNLQKDGTTGWCRECKNAYDRQPHRIKASNKNSAERRRLYKERHPEKQKEIERKSHRKQYLKNKEKYVEQARAWRYTHPERKREIANKYVHSEKGRKSGHINSTRRRTRMAGLPATLTSQEWSEIKEFYGNKCLSCGATDVKLEIDHVVPVVAGGGLTAANSQPLCKSCNTSKGTKIIDYRPDRGVRWE